MAGLTRLLEMPTLARAARFLVLAVDRNVRAGPVAADSTVYRWEWK
jgi:hypothetical protein